MSSDLAPTNSSQDGMRFHLWTVSNGPKSSVRHSALSSQLTSLPGLCEPVSVDFVAIFKLNQLMVNTALHTTTCKFSSHNLPRHKNYFLKSVCRRRSPPTTKCTESLLHHRKGTLLHYNLRCSPDIAITQDNSPSPFAACRTVLSAQ